MDSEQTLPVAPGEMVAGKYRIDRVLGAGGMGVVALATHAQLGQRVAIKFLLQRYTSNKMVVDRFEREARAAVRLRSDHVVRIIDVGTLDAGAPYIVMEYLEGKDLADVLTDRGPLPVHEAAQYVLQACEAVGEAHANGIIHRDLKPQNLFLATRMNGRPLVKVLDFGISKMAETGVEELTRTSDMMGSPQYMSPEHLMAARDVDARSDLWALGAILYKLLSGRLPFEGESVTQIMMKVMNAPPPPLQVYRQDVPPALLAIIDRCLQKDPARRYQSAGELAAALENLSAPQPAMSAPPTASGGYPAAMSSSGGYPAAPAPAPASASMPYAQTAVPRAQYPQAPPPPQSSPAFPSGTAASWTNVDRQAAGVPRRRPVMAWVAIGGVVSAILLVLVVSLAWSRLRPAPVVASSAALPTASVPATPSALTTPTPPTPPTIAAPITPPAVPTAPPSETPTATPTASAIKPPATPTATVATTRPTSHPASTVKPPPTSTGVRPLATSM